jgi:hypothetical protein
VIGSAGVGRSLNNIGVKTEGTPIHAGIGTLELSMAAAKRYKTVNQDYLAKYRLLPIENTIKINSQHVVSGVFFYGKHGGCCLRQIAG